MDPIEIAIAKADAFIVGMLVGFSTAGLAFYIILSLHVFHG